jgi:cytochrome c oxidase accessory protein FixG
VTSAAVGESLYAAHQKIYPREVTGKFSRLRNLSVVVLLGLYYLMPWVLWRGRQAVLFDLPDRKFYIFSLTLWPQDFVYLAWLLIMAALSLFFITALAGRLWCGYACPQTVWTEAFVWMERWTEGSRNAQIKLDAAPGSANKYLRKGAKQILWLAFATWTGFTFVAYFSAARGLLERAIDFRLGGWETFWVIFYACATYGNAGYLREQVCKYMCPYARFQSAMFDRDTLIISYDAERGEPRGARRRGADYPSLGLGACVDCDACVQVCPTGIDIRNGLQYECIACASCIDACDAVMDKMRYARGLVRYTTQHAVEHRHSHLLRPRTIAYAAMLLALFAGFLISLAIRMPLSVDVLRDRNGLYRRLPSGEIENVYTVKIMNKDSAAHRYALRVSGPVPLALESDPAEPVVPAGEVASVPVRLRTAASVTGGVNIELSVQSIDAPRLIAKSRARFIGGESS